MEWPLKVVPWIGTPNSTVNHCSSVINAFLAQSVSGWPSLLRFVVVPYYFHFVLMDLMALCRMFKIWDIFCNPISIYTSPQLCLSPGGRLGLQCACLVVLQTQRPFRTGVFILMSCDSSCDPLISHKWTLIKHLCDFWSSLVGPDLIYGFHSKVHNTYALTAVLFLSIYFFKSIFSFHFRNLDYIVRSIT